MTARALITVLLLCLGPAALQAGELEAPGFLIRYDSRAAGWAADVHRQASRSRQMVERRLGFELAGRVVIELPGTEERFVQVCRGYGATPPRWALAVAFSRMGVIVIKAAGISDQGMEGVAPTLMHELAHVVLAQVEREGVRLPRWLNEGLAMWAAGEYLRAPDRAALLAAARMDNLIPLAELERDFPPHTARASKAYNQSFSLIQFLADEHGKGTPAALLERMRAGQPFPEALETLTGWSPDELERAWAKQLANDPTYFMEILLTLPFWAFLALVVVYAWVRRRRQNRERLEEMAAEEAAEDAAGWNAWYAGQPE